MNSQQHIDQKVQDDRYSYENQDFYGEAVIAVTVSTVTYFERAAGTAKRKPASAKKHPAMPRRKHHEAAFSAHH